MNNKPEILIVDDMATSLKFLYEILIDCYTVRATTNGKLAIESAKNKTPDLIVLDVTMPSMDGFEVCKALKRDISTLNIPVIFISGFASEHDKNKGFEVGGADYIAKPFHSIQLLEKIEKYI